MFDPAVSRVTFIPPEGESVRTLQVFQPGPLTLVMDITRDGRLVAVSGIPTKAESPSAPGLWAQATIVITDPNEQVTDTIGTYLAFRCRDVSDVSA